MPLILPSSSTRDGSSFEESKSALTSRVLILPGYEGSGPQHWQTLWEEKNPSFKRVEQRDWNHPVCSEWMQTLEKAVSLSGPDTVLVAHSLACLLVVHWAASTSLSIAAAMLVAVPDPQSPNFPKAAIGFSPVPQQSLPFQSLIVASTNDPFGTIDYSLRCAAAWESEFRNIGAAGHINANSGLGEWREGFALLQTLLS